jgi:omega-6 fatty acid desaturase (delta-12 desaturase)
VINYWFAPWLVFHGWLSVLSLLHHTAPHIPFQEPSTFVYDHGRAVVNGTVVIELPAWLGAVINNAHIHLPQHLNELVRSAVDFGKKCQIPYVFQPKWPNAYLICK